MTPSLTGRHPGRSEAEYGRRGRRTLTLIIAAIFAFAGALAGHAQGCAQCLDSTQATPPQVQAAYRHAIYLLGGVGALLFIVGVVVIRRER